MNKLCQIHDQRNTALEETKSSLVKMRDECPNWEFMSMIREYRRNLIFRPLRESDPVLVDKITVCIRKRPLSKKEMAKKDLDVISVPSKNEIVVHEPRTKVNRTKFLQNHCFKLDYIFDETCDNDVIYKYTAQPLVRTVFEGGRATCFAYGQTGSGKTHTMSGCKIGGCIKGIYVLAAEDIFRFLESSMYKDLNLVVYASMFEIYNGEVYDLLANRKRLRVLEDYNREPLVMGLAENVADSVDELLEVIERGRNSRKSGVTYKNPYSSRSHEVFQIILRRNGSQAIHGKFSLIDLAGNEMAKSISRSTRERRVEGAEINKSLLALKECIRALGRKAAHLPFRNSKLTRILRDSFIGKNSMTCIIGTINPGMSACECSLNTLRYADRIKEYRSAYDTRRNW
jgi:kinesin family protein 2/24